jgi:putative component of toxin-antitoxin plasmid stabilization module
MELDTGLTSGSRITKTVTELKQTTTGDMRPVRAAVLRLLGDEQRGPTVELRLDLGDLQAA